MNLSVLKAHIYRELQFCMQKFCNIRFTSLTENAVSFQKTQSCIDGWSRHPLLTAMILNPKLSAWQDIKYGSEV